MIKSRPTPYSLLPTSEQGFTLIELMVAIAIMAIMATIMLVNLAGQRAARDLKIAENQLVTDIRATQSSTLSSRLLPSGHEPQYYFLKFDLNKPTQYTIESVYDVSSTPKLEDVQTVNFPPNIRLAAQSPIQISGRMNPNPQIPAYTSSPNPDCALLAFAAPFGKILFNVNQGCVALDTPPAVSSDHAKLGDAAYYNIINFITNIPCDGLHPSCSVSADSIMAITLTDVAQTVSKTVTVNGTTGSVTFN